MDQAHSEHEHETSTHAERLIEELIEREGGYVNHPRDKGGPTRFGITEAVARAHGYAGAMALLPREEAVAIYRRLYQMGEGAGGDRQRRGDYATLATRCSAAAACAPPPREMRH